MARDRNFYFRVKATDEALMFQFVDVEAEGLYSKLRRFAFGCEPRGFLVDFKRRPISIMDLADGFKMTNGRFRARFDELRERQIVQTAEEYSSALRTVPGGWSSRKISAMIDIIRELPATENELYVIPALVDDMLDAAVGGTNGSQGWEEDENGKKVRRSKSSKRDGGSIDPPNRPH